MNLEKYTNEANNDNTSIDSGPSQALDITLNNSELNDFSRDVAEVGLDNFLNDGLLKELPGIKALYSVWKFGRSISDAFFLKKLAVFLFELRDTTIEQRRRIIDKIQNEEEYASKVSEALVIIIDKLDDNVKPAIIGLLFKAVIEEHINYETFLRLAHTINMCFGLDLIRLGKSWNGNDVNKYNTDQFSIFNITETDFAAAYSDATAHGLTDKSGENSRTSLTKLGEQLVKYGLCKYH